MAKREFCMLAHVYKAEKHGLAGNYVSEKLDGMRAVWDGGVSRGIPADQVPYANVAKDGRYTEKQIATGLWSRYGKVIHAPKNFLDSLPVGMILDGELYAGRGQFQSLVSTVKKLNPDEWKDVRYMVFDSPAACDIFADGVINNINFKKTFTGCVEWACERGAARNPYRTFRDTYSRLFTHLPRNDRVVLHEQTMLPFSTPKAQEELAERLDAVTAVGGEGLIVRVSGSIWAPERSHTLLKVKPSLDAEGTVVGYTAGIGKLSGLMGSLRLSFNGKIFDLSGFTDAEREMTLTNGGVASMYLEQLAGGEVDPRRCISKQFPIGASVTFTYRELTDAKLPKEARYYRVC